MLRTMTASLRKQNGSLQHNGRLYAKQDYIPKQIDSSKTHLNVFYTSEPLIIGFEEDIDQTILEREITRGHYRRRPTEDGRLVIELDRVRDLDDLKAVVEWRFRDPLAEYRKTHKKSRDRNKNAWALLFGKRPFKLKELLIQAGSASLGQPTPEEISQIEQKLIDYLHQLHPDWLFFGDSHRDEKSTHLHLDFIPFLNVEHEKAMAAEFEELAKQKAYREAAEDKRRENKGVKKGKKRGSYDKMGWICNNDRAIRSTLNPDTGKPFTNWIEWRNHVDGKITEYMKELGIERISGKGNRKIHIEHQIFSEYARNMDVLQDQISKLRTEMENLRSENLSSEKKKAELSREVVQLDSRLLKSQATIDKLAAEIENRELKAGELLTRVQAAQGQLTVLETEIQQTRRLKEQLESEIADLDPEQTSDAIRMMDQAIKTAYQEKSGGDYIIRVPDLMMGIFRRLWAFIKPVLERTARTLAKTPASRSKQRQKDAPSKFE